MQKEIGDRGRSLRTIIYRAELEQVVC
jgi:hypothetical protein